MTLDLMVFDDATDLADQIAQRLTLFVNEAHDSGGEPNVVLTGGTIAIAAYQQLDATAADWGKVHWWWGDERFVPDGHADRNDRQARAAFLDRAQVPADHIHAMPAHGCSESMAEAASGYGATLPDRAFDLVLLGVGPDGHVASLFPGSSQLDETARPCVEVFGAPKPPPERITLTFPRLSHARHVWFLVSGAEKAEAVGRAVTQRGTIQDTPALGVSGTERTVWLLDESAASRIRK